MPTITYNKSELKRLIGKKISDQQLVETITLIKPNLEKEEPDKITIEHTADRPDLFGPEGMARAISLYLGMKKQTKYKLLDQKLKIKISHIPSRPYVVAAVIRKVKMNRELLQGLMNIQEILHASTGRNRRKAAIGMHDLDKIEGDVVYREGERDEKMAPLGSDEDMTLRNILDKNDKGLEYGHLIRGGRIWPVFSDKKGIISLPPIINSNRTAVTESTKNILIEATGTDKESVNNMMNIIVTNLAERGFGIEPVKLAHEKKSEQTPKLDYRVLEIDVGDANKILGTKIEPKEATALLSRMGYESVAMGNKLEAIIPPYRVDILHPVDVIEDMAIAYGYNNFIPNMPSVGTVGRRHPIEKISDNARMSMIGSGFQEIMRSMLSNPSDQFDKMCLKPRGIIEIENPTSSDYTCIRPSLLPGLIKTLTENRQNEYPQNIFEVGDIVLPDETRETASKNYRTLCGIVSHSKAGFSEIKSILDVIMGNFGIRYSTKKYDQGCYIPGRSELIVIGDQIIGSIGEVHPQVLENWGLVMPCASFEISLENIQ